MVLASLVAVLGACSATKDIRRVPTPLTDIKPVLEVKQAWKASVGKGGRYLFQPAVADGAVFAAGANGSVGKFDAQTGKTLWKIKIGSDLSAGVGTDGKLSAVGSVDGTLFVLDADGKVSWKANVSGEILSAPLVGNGFVIVRTVDGRVTAFDAQTGEQKWVFRNRAVPLNLRTTLGLTFAGTNAVLAGFPGGALAAISLANGDAFWQSPVSFPQGVTEVERINDVSGTPQLVGRLACAGTFQGKIGCFDVESGQPVWAHAFSTYSGVAEDDQTVVAADDWSVVKAFDANSGKQLWENTQLKSRDLNRPVLLGRTVVVGDYQGFVHFLSRDTGEFVARMKTDKSPITAPAVVAGPSLVVQTKDGDLYAFQPQ
ncbi:outer membrane protein assembly factor BamB [Robbsia betulipollinis]|uniref:outer membrane protein assembly factor BamB n=1 Tax=Robbsia betulipollinis TaxID=2981849 RepID=UPI003D7B0A35